jgi:ankyrin repeat protein
MPGCAIERGMTRLMTAAAAGSPEDVKVLLAHGADATLTDWEGRTAADYARTAGHPGVVALFRATRTSSVGK